MYELKHKRYMVGMRCHPCIISIVRYAHILYYRYIYSYGTFLFSLDYRYTGMYRYRMYIEAKYSFANTINRLQLFLTAKIAVSDLQSISSPWNQHFFLPYYIIRESERDVRARVIVRIQLYTKRESSSSNNSTNNTNNISGAIGDFHFTIHLYFLVCRIPI